MKNLVGVRVADARERARIGERALQRMPLGGERGAELGLRALEDVDAARIVLGELCLAAHDIERGALFLARLREQQGPALEIEGREPDFAWDLGALVLPLQAAGDHE